ncbi:MAG: hypothetical protein ACE5HU_02970 [Acidobacteriota bacterium]
MATQMSLQSFLSSMHVARHSFTHATRCVSLAVPGKRSAQVTSQRAVQAFEVALQAALHRAFSLVASTGDANTWIKATTARAANSLDSLREYPAIEHTLLISGLGQYTAPIPFCKN